MPGHQSITVVIQEPDDMESSQLVDFLHEFCALGGRKLQRTKYEEETTYNLVLLPEVTPNNGPSQSQTRETT